MDDKYTTMSNMKHIEQFMAAANKYASLYIQKPHIAAFMEKEDLISEAYLALDKGHHAFEDGRGAKYTSYMIQRIKWRMMEIDRACAKRMLKSGFLRSLDALTEEDRGDTWHPAYTDADNLSDAEEAQALMAHLSDRQREVVTRRLAGDTLQAIADDQGVTRERIRQIEAKAMEIMG
jgi:RNA polymerase sigma factor (sigma-70 family)